MTLIGVRSCRQTSTSWTSRSGTWRRRRRGREKQMQRRSDCESKRRHESRPSRRPRLLLRQRRSDCALRRRPQQLRKPRCRYSRRVDDVFCAGSVKSHHHHHTRTPAPSLGPAMRAAVQKCLLCAATCGLSGSTWKRSSSASASRAIRSTRRRALVAKTIGNTAIRSASAAQSILILRSRA